METPSRIEIAGGTHVTLTWGDGVQTVVPAARLREVCPCAGCRSDEGERRTEQVLRDPDAIRVSGAHVVGAYAVSFEFGPDAHRTGIFSYELLRSLGSNEIQPGGRIG